MKSFLVTLSLFALPLVTSAQVQTANQLSSLKNRPLINATERAELRAERREQLQNQRPIDPQVATETDHSTALQALRSRRPANAIEAVQIHEEVINERIQQLQDNDRIPEEKKTELIQKLSDELAWMQDKNTALQNADTMEERQAIRKEIATHAHTEQQNRRQTLAKAITLPEQSPAVIAQQINDRFTQISDRLERTGKDTTALNAAITQYQTAVTNLSNSYTAAQSDQTVETLQQLRDSIEAVRTSGEQVRNAIQSLLEY